MEPVLVSVIIPCYNHARFLSKAIESVLQQDYSEHEILVVDDGSVDNTPEVASQYPSVRYIYQHNQGLAAARNTGISRSTGKLLVFLDADDWLLPEALGNNLNYIAQHPEAAFVSGAYELVRESANICCTIYNRLSHAPYLEMLVTNYIGMHATVMYRRWVFDRILFDTSLPYCEDYDIYLKIARHYPVVHHARAIAVYRMHGSNMSDNFTMMMQYALEVLQRQEPLLANEAERAFFQHGQQQWIAHYTGRMYEKLVSQEQLKILNPMDNDYKTLHMYNPDLYNDLRKERWSYKVKSMIPSFVKRAYKKMLRSTYTPAPGKVQFGDLYRTTPLSVRFGYDRGGPIDRYYIEAFLEQQKELVKGRVLEIGDNAYTLRYGGDRVTTSDVLHVSSDNPQATFVGDLSNAPQLPDNAFDCIVLTQTLHLIYECRAALGTCYRILKPGGTLLLTVPGISHIAQDEWRKYWLWSFTALSLGKMLDEHFSHEKTEIETYGNTLVASSFLYGLGLPELGKKQLDYRDPHFQLVITGVATK